MNKILLLLTPTFICCSLKIGSVITNIQPKFEATENVVIVTAMDTIAIEGILVGEISSTDYGLSKDCSYPEIIKSLKSITRENGANIIEINSHKTADNRSNCDRIKAHIYRVSNSKKYESLIEWSADRKLTWEDFKGDVPENKINTRFAATTGSELSFQTNTVISISKLKFFVTNNFNCYTSWVKQEERNDALLNHEQGHFDLAEIYARILRVRLNNLIKTRSDVNSKTESINNKVFSELSEKQEEYDRQTNHGLNKEKQKEWDSYIALKLIELSPQL